MTKLVDLPAHVHKDKLTFGLFDDFFEYVTADVWTLVTTTDGVATLGTTVGGEIAIKSAANDGADTGDKTGMIVSTAKPFFFAANKPIAFGARVKIGSTPTAGDHQFFAGVSNVITDGLITVNGGGMIGTNDCVGFYAKEGSTIDEQMYAIFQNDTVADSITLNAATSLDGVGYTATTTYKLLEFVWLPVTSSVADVMYYIDGVQVARSTNVTYTTTTATMSIVLAAMSGAGTTLETITCDYVYCYQTR